MDIYREFLIELYKNPKNYGEMETEYKAHVYNAVCGDMITLFLKMENGKVENATFIGKGCVISQASASLFTEYLKGKTIEEIKEIEKDDVLKLLKIDLSKNPSRMKCALLPLDALRQMEKKRT
ncbi:iron-sulfur cluster assembly scaffold protein [Candidatus Micrarchaeota archaeon]|nr:iron-sulfur cluster assembly scaffold protein [Candidatus Micrarchaeota archaeon]